MKPIDVVTDGYLNSPLSVATSGYLGAAVIALAWREVIRFTLYMRNKITFKLN